MSSSNALSFQIGDDTALIGRNAAGRILFSASVVSAFTVSISDHALTVSRELLDVLQQLPVPAADKWLKWNSAGSALENTDAPSGGGGAPA